MKTAIPCVIWRKIDYPRSDHPNPSAERMYLRSDTDAESWVNSWSARKDDAHVFGSKAAATQVLRRLRHPAITLGIEAAATVDRTVQDKEAKEG